MRASLKPGRQGDGREGSPQPAHAGLELDCRLRRRPSRPPRRQGPPRARAATLDLARKLRDGAKMRIGTAECGAPTVPGPADGSRPEPDRRAAGRAVPPPANDLNRDLPRIGALLDLGVVKEDDFPENLRDSPTFRQRAFIGDPRNDENLVVAQFHLALLRFHNAVVDWLRFKDPRRREAGRRRSCSRTRARSCAGPSSG